MNVRKIILASALATLLLLPAFAAEAQVRFAVEGRAGVTFPTGDLSDGRGEAGLGLGGELHLNFRRNLTAYVGYNHHTFNCDGSCTYGSDPKSSGIGGGLKYIFPGPSDALVWGRAGIISHRFSTDTRESDRNLGFELGAGVDMPVAHRIYLVPHVGFLSHDAGSGITANYVTFGVGMHFHLN